MNINRIPLPRATLLWNVALGTLVLVYVAATLWLFHPVYETSDNLAILRNVVDGYTVDYAGVLLTGLWHLLYSAAPDVPWYGLTLYALHIVSMYLWLRCFRRAFKPWWVTAAVASIFLIYYLSVLVRLDYTSTGLMLCLAAITWACLDVMEGRVRRWRFVAAGAVFMLGMLVRPQAGWGSLAYGLPVALVALLHSLSDGRTLDPTARLPELAGRLRGVAVAALLFLAPAVVTGLFDAGYRHATMTPVQARYDAFETYRVRLSRMSRARKRQIIFNRPVLDSIHWTRNDAFRYFGWEYYDERKYTPANLQVLWDHFHRDIPHERGVLRTLRNRVRPWPGLFLLCASLPLFLVVCFRRRYLGIAGMALPFWCLGLSSAMYLFVIFQYRTELPYTLGFGFASLVVAGWLARREAPDRSYLLAACAGVALALPGAYLMLSDVIGSAHARATHMERAERKLDWLNRNAKGAVIFAEPGGGLRFDKLSPLDSTRQDFDAFSPGWDTFSPDFYQRITALGITQGYEVPVALVDHSNAYTLGAEQWCHLVAKTAKTAGPVQVSILQRFPDQTVLCRLIRTPALK